MKYEPLSPYRPVFSFSPALSLVVLGERLGVCKLPAQAPVPTWAWEGPFCAVTRTKEELSIVCAQTHIPRGIVAEKGFCAFQVKGPLDFGLVGILASLTTTLAQAGISLFAISTYDTDYVLVREKDLAAAIHAFQRQGYLVEQTTPSANSTKEESL